MGYQEIDADVVKNLRDLLRVVGYSRGLGHDLRLIVVPVEIMKYVLRLQEQWRCLKAKNYFDWNVNSGSSVLFLTI